MADKANDKKEEIEDVVLNASYILSTVKFNDNIIKIMLNIIMQIIWT